MGRNQYDYTWGEEGKKERLRSRIMLIILLIVFCTIMSVLLIYLPEKAAIAIMILLALFGLAAMVYIYTSPEIK